MSTSYKSNNSKSIKGKGNSMNERGHTMKKHKHESNNNRSKKKKNKNSNNDNSKRDRSRVKHAYNNYEPSKYCKSIKLFRKQFEVYLTEVPTDFNVNKFSKFVNKRQADYQKSNAAVAVFDGVVYFGYHHGDGYNNMTADTDKVRMAESIASKLYANALKEFKAKIQKNKQNQEFVDNKEKYEREKEQKFAKMRKENSKNEKERKQRNSDRRKDSRRRMKRAKNLFDKMTDATIDEKIRQCEEISQQQKQRQQQQQEYKNKVIQNMKDVGNEMNRLKEEVWLCEQEKQKLKNEVYFAFHDKESIPRSPSKSPLKSRLESPYQNNDGLPIGLKQNRGVNRSQNGNPKDRDKQKRKHQKHKHDPINGNTSKNKMVNLKRNSVLIMIRVIQCYPLHMVLIVVSQVIFHQECDHLLKIPKIQWMMIMFWILNIQVMIDQIKTVNKLIIHDHTVLEDTIVVQVITMNIIKVKDNLKQKNLSDNNKESKQKQKKK